MRPVMPNRNAAACRAASLFCTLCVLLLTIVGVAPAQTTDLVRTQVDPANRVPLTGHHPAWASLQNDAGAVPADLPMERLTVVLARPPQVEQAYTQFLKDQQDPASPDYHHWLTPVQIGKRFGVSSHDLQAVTVWLQSQNLTVDAVSNSRQRITFSGPASAVGNAFGAELHYFTVNGEKRISINTEPQIPAALAAVIKSVSGLFTVKLYPQHESETVQAPSHNVGSNWRTIPDATFCSGSTCSNIIFPADFATIYNLNGVTGGINGAGQTIAIVGRSRVCTADITNFATQAAVTANVPTVIVPPLGVDPGPAACSGSASGDQSEATLDVTRSGSVAQGATLDLVISGDTSTQDGIQIAVAYAVDTNPVPAHIMSISFGNCEASAGAPGVQFWDSLFTEAAGEGISVFVSSGDSAAAGCDTAFTTPPPTQSLSPNSICASSYATCVGGTEFADAANPSQYWSSTNGNGFESALGYIPEGAWNEPLNGNGQPQVAGTGGGVSSFIATPSYQTGTGVPAARSGRYTPDVAFSASDHDGYFGCLAAGGGSCVVNNGSFGFEVFSGTSAAAPDMAGITALLNQKEGSAQGLLNPNLYTLAATPTNAVFNDVTVASSGVTGCVVTTPSMCNNSTAGPTGLTGGLSGYLVTAGYDEATGLGSINVANLLNNWSSSSLVATTTTLTASPASPVNVGTSVTFTATVKPSSASTKTPTGTVTFSDPTLGKLGTATLNSSGVATLASTTLAGASYSITATYGGDTNFSGSTSSALPYNVQDFKIAASPPTVTVAAPGGSGTTTLTITPLGGFSQTLTYSCTGLPPEATCTFPTAATGGTLTISTTAASSRLDKDPFGRHRGTFYALLLPGFFGLLISTENRKRGWHRVRLLSLLLVLALSTLWMPACGGSSGQPSNPGTPAGTSTVTVSATTGGTSALTHTATVTLTVQ
ncbi:MAG: protease pro-enzyme activation domain-containing protein [Terriglobales bacterium]